jgi:hypothetical protein
MRAFHPTETGRKVCKKLLRGPRTGRVRPLAAAAARTSAGRPSPAFYDDNRHTVELIG